VEDVQVFAEQDGFALGYDLRDFLVAGREICIPRTLLSGGGCAGFR